MVVVVPHISENKSCDGSFVKMPSSKIIEMANKTLQWIIQQRKKEVAQLIKNEREYIVNGFWHKLFKKPVPTDEEILSSINSVGGGDVLCIPETVWIRIRYSASENVAYRLLNAARYTDEIYVSTEDLQEL